MSRNGPWYFLNKQTMNQGGYNVSCAYDANGNQTDVTDAKGTIHTDYDELNRQWHISYPNGRNKYFDYDNNGRKKQYKDEEEKITDYSYDCQWRMDRVTQHLNGVLLNTVYGYDKAGNLITQTDALGRVTRFEYDVMGRRVKRILPEGQEERYEYDPLTGLMTRKNSFIAFLNFLCII